MAFDGEVACAGCTSPRAPCPSLPLLSPSPSPSPLFPQLQHALADTQHRALAAGGRSRGPRRRRRVSAATWRCHVLLLLLGADFQLTLSSLCCCTTPALFAEPSSKTSCVQRVGCAGTLNVIDSATTWSGTHEALGLCTIAPTLLLALTDSLTVKLTILKAYLRSNRSYIPNHKKTPRACTHKKKNA